MEGFRHIAAPIVVRGVMPIAAASVVVALFGQPKVALALLAGGLMGFAYQYHIALGFNRLAERQKAQIPLVIFESVLRVLVVGAAPVLIVGRGPIAGYIAYFVGFVAPFAVAIFTIRNLMNADTSVTSRSS